MADVGILWVVLLVVICIVLMIWLFNHAMKQKDREAVSLKKHFGRKD